MKRTKTGKANSFRKEKTTLVPVIDRGDGTKAWFAKKRITVNLSSKSRDDLADKQTEITILLFDAARALAKERNISPEDARNLFTSQQVNSGVEAISVNFLDYLNGDQMRQYLTLQKESMELQVDVATLLIQERLAFDVTIHESIEKGSYRFEAPGFDVAPGDLLKFGTNVLTVSTVDGEAISFREEVKLSSGSVGFLVDDDGEYVLGDSDWTKDMALLMLDESQVQAAADFYESCLPGRSLKDEGNSLSPSNSTDSLSQETPPELIGGEKSTPNVAPSESQPKTIDSPTETLAIAQ